MMLSAAPTAGVLTLSLLIAGKATAKYCDGGHYCTPPKECCAGGCCYVYTPPMYRPQVPAATSLFSIVFWNHWYFWGLVLVVLASCAGGCGLWRRRHALLRPCYCCCYCCREQSARSNGEEISSEPDSGTSCYAPPDYSRCGSFHHSPPPYNEVTSKPDLYPLVISFGGDNGKNVPGSCLMVQYFRNYIVRPVGSLSAASTVDSLSSSFTCGAGNAGDVPPPYPGALPPSAAPSPPPSSILLPSCCSHTDFGGLSGSEVSSLGLGTPGSPPRATSPTRLFLPLEQGPILLPPAVVTVEEEASGGDELRELLDKIHALPTASPQTPANVQQNATLPSSSSPPPPVEPTSPPRAASLRATRPRAWTPNKGGYAPLSQGLGSTTSSRRPRRASWLSLASPRGALPPGSWSGSILTASSRSAPSTPNSQLAPPLTTLLQNEGSSPLLEADSEEEEEQLR